MALRSGARPAAAARSLDPRAPEPAVNLCGMARLRVDGAPVGRERRRVVALDHLEQLRLDRAVRGDARQVVVLEPAHACAQRSAASQTAIRREMLAAGR